MTSTVTVKAAFGGPLEVVTQPGLPLNLDGRPDVSQELLGVAVAGSYANSLFAEAAARGVWLSSLEVAAEIEWEADPPRTRSVTVHVGVAADADEPMVRELVEHADRVSRVANSLRLGVPLRVADLHVTVLKTVDGRQPGSRDSSA